MARGLQKGRLVVYKTEKKNASENGVALRSRQCHSVLWKTKKERISRSGYVRATAGDWSSRSIKVSFKRWLPQAGREAMQVGGFLVQICGQTCHGERETRLSLRKGLLNQMIVFCFLPLLLCPSSLAFSHALYLRRHESEAQSRRCCYCCSATIIRVPVTAAFGCASAVSK